MDKLDKKIIKLFTEEILNLNIGYEFNQKNIECLIELLYLKDYLVNNDIEMNEYFKLISYYELY